MSRLNHNPLRIGLKRQDKAAKVPRNANLPIKDEALEQIRQDLPSDKDNQVNQ